MAPVEIRPLQAEDVNDVVEVWLAAFSELRSRLHLPVLEAAVSDRLRIAGRVDHLRATDPGGSWVADEGGRVTGLAQSFVRQSYWVLSLLGVHPAAQAAGVGRALLERAMAHGAGFPGTIQASDDPRAARLYATAGFDLHPSMTAWGPVGPERPPPPPGIRIGGVDDLDVVADIDRAVRGSERTTDLRHLLDRDGAVLLIDGDAAYAVAKPDRVIAVAGRDEPSASGMLAGALSLAPPDGHFEISWLTAPQQWAVRVALAAGLALRPRGPVMVRGMEGPPAPYLPSGGFG